MGVLAATVLACAALASPGRATGQTTTGQTPLEQASHVTPVRMMRLYRDVQRAFRRLEPQTIRKASGYIPHDYLIPAGYYTQMWDWDGFFIGSHLAAESVAKARYLRWWVLDFAKAVDDSGYVSGCITPQGPRPVFGIFAMKPFLAQGALLASRRLGDFRWLAPIYPKLKRVIAYRERTQFDPRYGLFYWDNAGESGVDNSVVLTNDPHDRGAILAVDMNTWELREDLSMAVIARRLGHEQDAATFTRKARALRSAIMRYLWFPRDHSFWNVRRDTGRPIKRVSFQNFVPLFQGLLSRKEGRAMIRDYLWNPQTMLSPYGLRSLSRQDPAYNNRATIVPYSNWRGPIWINANYLYSVMLVRYGFERRARELAYMIGELVLRDVRADGSMHENYDADTGAPLAPTARESGGVLKGFVGWDLLAEDMLRGAVTGRWMLLRVE